MTNEGQSPNYFNDSVAPERTTQSHGRQPEGNHPVAAQGMPQKSSRGRRAAILLVAAIVVALLVASGIIPRLRSRRALAAETSELAAPTVLVIQPKRGAPSQEIVLPGNIQAFVDAPIYARTSGYLKRWYFDIGSHVKQGQLLAEIETPELDEQLEQAENQLKTAEANLQLSQVTADRWVFLEKSSVVSKQE